MQNEVETMANYKDWIDAIDVEVDYFSAFMKAWIAFNAWYESGEIDGNTDKDKIDYISNKTNRFKTYMNNLLVSDTEEGISFRESVARLHEYLRSAAITTQEYIGVRQAVSFAEVAVKNQNNLKRIDHRTYHYECSRSSGIIRTFILRKSNSDEVFRFEQEEHNVEALKQQASFMALTDTQQEKCLECYFELRPYIIESVLDTSDAAKKIGAYNFVNDENKISRAIIIMLYLLRCALAHGDISPDTTANNVYRYAYEVLVPPLRKLR
jgi:hypothetical protein